MQGVSRKPRRRREITRDCTMRPTVAEDFSPRWQAMTGVTHTYGWGDVGLVYRHLAYDQGSDGLLQNLSFSGPALSFTFHL